MAKITGNSRISHHTITGTGTTFSVPPSEDFTDGTWNTLGTELCLSEIGINETDSKAYIRVGSTIKQLVMSGATGYGNLNEVLSLGNDSGSNNIIMGTGSSIVFGSNINSGADSIVSGQVNSNSGDYSVVLGVVNINSGDDSVVLGASNTNSGNYSAIIGGTLNTNSSDYSVVSGYSNTNSGICSIILGSGNVNTSAQHSIISGYNNTNTGNYSAIIGGNTNTNSGTNSVVLGGTGITATQANTVYVPDLRVQAGKSIRSTAGGGDIYLNSGYVFLSTDNGTYNKSCIDLSHGGGGNSVDIYAGAVTSTQPQINLNYSAGLTRGYIKLKSNNNYLYVGTNGSTYYDIVMMGTSASNITIGNTTPGVNNIEINTTVGSLLVSRLTTTQKNAITPINGMILYDSTLNKFQGYEAGAWTNLI